MSDKRPAAFEGRVRFSDIERVTASALTSGEGDDRMTWLDIESAAFWRPDRDPDAEPTMVAAHAVFWGEPAELLALAERIRDAVLAEWPELTPRRLIWIETTEHGSVEHDLGPASAEQAARSDEIAELDGMGIFLIDSDNNPTMDVGPDWRGMAPRAVYVEAR